ncbi:MAG TPA: SDR family oxidoreductase [Propionibacteriaceae bacterium]
MISTVKYPFESTVVLVTGAGDGIGKAIARAFLEQGASVCGIGRTAATLEAAFEGFPAERTLALTVDVSKRDEVDEAVAMLVARFGRLDVVINNAGVYEGAELEDFTDEQWERVRGINLDGLLYVVRAAIPHLKSSGGNIVAISSVSGIRGDWGQFAYNATKGATNTMMQSLALDLGPAGVRVNVVAPAFTETRLTSARLDDPDFSAALLNRIALGRPGQPEDVARVALFLASPDAGYLTGVILPVDGGTTASTGQPNA